MMIRTMLAIAAVAVGVTTVAAQQDPIAARKAAMKAVGQQTGLGAKYAKGEEAFDLTKAKAIFATYIEASEKVPNLFPENSKTGGETAALPAIWTNMADFKAKLAKLGAEAKTAQTAVKDLDTFKAAFGNITKNCGGCHETYRMKKS